MTPMNLISGTNLIMDMFCLFFSLSGGTLSEYVKSHVVLTDYTSTRLMRKMMEGLQHLHQYSLVHTNLTVSSLLRTWT